MAMSYKCYKCDACEEYYPIETAHVTISSGRYPGKSETRKHLCGGCWDRMMVVVGIGLATITGDEEIEKMIDDIREESE